MCEKFDFWNGYQYNWIVIYLHCYYSLMNYSITIYNDQSAQNPWENWDCLPMLYTDGWRQFTTKGYQWFDFLKLVKAKLNNRNAYKVLELLDYTNRKEIAKDIKDYQYNWIVEYCIEKLYDNKPYYVDTMESILKLLKYNVYAYTSHWYSQGDAIDCLFVSNDTKYNFDSDKKLRDAYARGDVYGYRVIENKPLYHADWTLAEEVEEVDVDSCRWYYWDDGLKDIFETCKDYITQEQFDEAKENIKY